MDNNITRYDEVYKKSLREVFYEKIRNDFLVKVNENGINDYKFQVQDLTYIAHMTDEQLSRTCAYTIDIIEELKKQYLAGLTKDAFEKKMLQTGSDITAWNVCVNNVIKDIVREIDEMFLLDPFDADIIVNQELYNVIFVVYKRLLDEEFDEDVCLNSIYFLIRGIMRMGYEPVE